MTTMSEDEALQDKILKLLRVERRRLVVDFLDRNENGATIGEISEWIAAEENGCQVGEITPKQRQRAYIKLYQRHLEKLEQAGVIHFDKDDTKKVTRASLFGIVRDVLRAVERSFEEKEGGGSDV